MIGQELLSEEAEPIYTDGQLMKLAEWMDIPLATIDELRELFG